MMNYFAILGIEEQFNIDLFILKKHYYQLQALHHPDTLVGEEPIIVSDIKSEDINEAYNVLKDDFLRAEHLLQLQGQNFDDPTLRSLLPPAELEKILAEQEMVENSDDLVYLENLMNRKLSDKDWLIHKLGQYFQENKIAQALELTVRMKYVMRLVEAIKHKINNANQRDY